MKPIRFSRSARKHRIGRVHADHVISYGTYAVETDPVTGNPALIVEGNDDRGVELRIVIIEHETYFLVIHVQPAYRRRT
ncbi:MAG: hypothetical protein M3179_02240 [Actinomycetota bacterium]|nr:hypothetical protein [Actinomycetota bacterium]